MISFSNECMGKKEQIEWETAFINPFIVTFTMIQNDQTSLFPIKFNHLVFSNWLIESVVLS
jgi:hypothetical protein